MCTNRLRHARPLLPPEKRGLLRGSHDCIQFSEYSECRATCGGVNRAWIRHRSGGAEAAWTSHQSTPNLTPQANGTKNKHPNPKHTTQNAKHRTQNTKHKTRESTVLGLSLLQAGHDVFLRVGTCYPNPQTLNSDPHTFNPKPYAPKPKP